jgi:hypothetical protein
VPCEGIAKGTIFGYGTALPFSSDWEEVGTGAFALSANGDTVIAYCVESNEVIIHPLGALSISGDWSTPRGISSSGTRKNGLPPTLANLAPALPHFDNYVYEGITIGNKAMLQSSLFDAHNWLGSNTVPLTFQAASFTVTSTITGCSDLSPGDVQVVAINSDNPDSVTLVALEGLPAGMKLYMTDNTWAGDSFLTNEGTVLVSNVFEEHSKRDSQFLVLMIQRSLCLLFTFVVHCTR